jgi:hypothetical protein
LFQLFAEVLDSEFNQMEIIEKMDRLLALQTEAPSLGDEPPGKGQTFTLWRGERDVGFAMTSRLQRAVKKLYGDEWKTRIKDHEKGLLNRFLTDILPRQDLKVHCSDFKPEKHGKTDTLWFLSVMQHYGCSTRLVDFTTEFWTALFFAARGASENTDMGLYSLTCVNADDHDNGGNKLPKDCKGNNPLTADPNVNINTFLGHIIGYDGFDENGVDRSLWESPRQPFGWDQPKDKNARVEAQKGYFVYPVHVTQTEILVKDTFTKYRIQGRLLCEIRRALEKNKINRRTRRTAPSLGDLKMKCALRQLWKSCLPSDRLG